MLGSVITGLSVAMKVIDVVSKINGGKITHWLRHNFKKVNWMRSDNNFKFYRTSKKGL